MGEGPFRGQTTFDVNAGPPSPVGELLDMSEGTQLRDVLIARKKRRYDLVALLLLMFVSLVVLVVLSILDPGFFALLFGAAAALGAVVVLLEIALDLFGHKRLIVDGEALILRSCIGPRIARTHRLPLLQIR